MSKPISATDIRRELWHSYSSAPEEYPDVPESVALDLKSYRGSPEWERLRQEYLDDLAYERKFQTVPMPYGGVNFLTGDAVVIESGHVLLIQRKNTPGKGLWALPGGHIGQNETILDGILRELYEETNIDVPERVLRGSIHSHDYFDAPNRSSRCRVETKSGRTLTIAYSFLLNGQNKKGKFTKVKGQDSEVDNIRWVPLSDLKGMRNQIFEDHFDIINRMIGKI